MTDAKTLRQSVQMLLAERAALKRRNHEIAQKLHLLRVKLSRLPDAGDDMPDAGDTPAPTTSQGNMLDDLERFLNDL